MKDDCEPVTEEWLKSIGWDQKDSNNWPMSSLPGGHGIAWRGAGIWIVHYEIPICRCVTKKEMRTFCKVVGIRITDTGSTPAMGTEKTEQE